MGIWVLIEERMLAIGSFGVAAAGRASSNLTFFLFVYSAGCCVEDVGVGGSSDSSYVYGIKLSNSYAEILRDESFSSMR